MLTAAVCDIYEHAAFYTKCTHRCVALSSPKVGALEHGHLRRGSRLAQAPSVHQGFAASPDAIYPKSLRPKVAADHRTQQLFRTLRAARCQNWETGDPPSDHPRWELSVTAYRLLRPVLADLRLRS